MKRWSLLPLLVPALISIPAVGCGSSSDDDDEFVVRTTTHAAVPASSSVRVGGLWLVYLASETFTGIAGTDLNGDGLSDDDVAVAVNMNSTAATVLRAAQQVAILGNEIYLVVQEMSDGVDWSNSNGQNDTVLLHWSAAAGGPTFVDIVDPQVTDEPLPVVGTRVYYSAANPLLLADETSIRFIESTMPTTPVAVLNQAGAGPVEIHPFREENGLVFLFADETTSGMDLNGDADATDERVLYLLDGTDAAARAKGVGLALLEDDSPVAASPRGTGDWLVAFLVDEFFQGGTNLNDQDDFNQPLVPDACLPTPDTDASDEVLHFLEYAAFLGGSAPVSTGLAGRDRVLAFGDFVATLSDEADANCDLNQDGDMSDTIARWVEAVTPVAPVRDENLLHAVASATPGGALGLAWLDDPPSASVRLIAVVDEAADDQDLDGKLPDHELVGWLDPALGGGASWHFQHQDPNVPSFGTGIFDSDGDSEPFAGTSWLAPAPVGGRLGVTFLEEVPGTNANVGSLNTNLDCDFVPKDTDKLDALPVWADFESGPVLDWDGVGYAVDPMNAGIVVAGGVVFFRVSESADNLDYNADGDENDVMLFRNPLTTCTPVSMGVSSPIAGEVIVTDGLGAGAFLASESQAGVDYDGDGDTSDLVVRYFLF